nr:MAG TPA: hypothetical protein [Caudoviricetes sp.]
MTVGLYSPPQPLQGPSTLSDGMQQRHEVLHLGAG